MTTTRTGLGILRTKRDREERADLFRLLGSQLFRGSIQSQSPRGETGSAMVEMAISMVLLLTILFGLIEMCFALYTYHYISDAAREGTRYAIVRGSSCQVSGVSCTVTAAQIQSYVQDLGFPGINSSATTVTTAWSGYPAGSACSPSASCNNPGNMVQVTVNYQFPLAIPFIPSSTLSMSSTSSMVISQ